MELAFLLIVLVIAELVITVWLLARIGNYRKSVAKMSLRLSEAEGNIRGLASVQRDALVENASQAATAYPVDSMDDIDMLAAADIDTMSVEDSMALLSKLGLFNKKD